MQSNWSLILNVLLLVGVIVAIGRLMKARGRKFSPESYQFANGAGNANPFAETSFNDDIISVRKVNDDGFFTMDDEPVIAPAASYQESAPIQEPIAEVNKQPTLRGFSAETIDPEDRPQGVGAKTNYQHSLMIFIVAKEHRQFAGYELLQTVLACGLRFGEGNLFYRHQFANGQGPVLCGLAAATSSGTFDMQNIGAFSVRGLCLFMHVSNNPTIDNERFSIMLETAKQLSEGLDAILLDDERKPLSNERLKRYYDLLNIE